MTRDEFLAVVKAFAEGPQPYRHLYVWYGETDELMSLFPSSQVQQLDLFRVAAELPRHPFAQEEANELLRDALRIRLQDWHTRDTDFCPILIITGCELLARYRVGLQPFHEVLSDHSMVVLVCSMADMSYKPARRLPDYVICEPGRTLAYLSRLVEEDHVISAS